jgi:large subunit ribosomal protein L37Ae
MAKTKIVKAAGRFGVRYGQSIKRRIAKIEGQQRKKQACSFCNGRAIRLAKGIWRCNRCKKTFAGHTYFLEKFYTANPQRPSNTKVLKEEKPVQIEEKEKKSKKKKSK